MNRLDFIDSLKGMAILGVLIVHSGMFCSGLPGAVKTVIEQGSRSVLLFYIVSALSLFLSLDRRKEQETHLYKNFFIRRFFRIVPMFYGAVVFYLFFYGLGPNYWLGDAKNISAGNIISHFLFVHGWNPYWINSIMRVEWAVAAEMTFYLLIPCLFKNIKSLYSAIAATLILYILISQINYIMDRFPLISDEGVWRYFLEFWFPTQLPVFGLGIVLYFLLFENGEIKGRLFQMNNKKIISFCYSLISLGLIGIIAYIYKSIPYYARSWPFGLAFTVFAYAIAIYPPKIIVNKFWCFLGKISFSIYLMHMAVLPLSDRLARFILGGNMPVGRYLLVLAITLFLTASMSYIAYNLVEQPLQNIGKRLIGRNA